MCHLFCKATCKPHQLSSSVQRRAYTQLGFEMYLPQMCKYHVFLSMSQSGNRLYKSGFPLPLNYSTIFTPHLLSCLSSPIQNELSKVTKTFSIPTYKLVSEKHFSPLKISLHFPTSLPKFVTSKVYVFSLHSAMLGSFLYLSMFYYTQLLSNKIA